MSDPLKNKQIVLGVCGGIAAYKAADFARQLVKAGSCVRVVMTQAARAFVGPVTFEALTGNPVWTSMFDQTGDGVFRHLEWARESDAAVIIPATANIIGKMAHAIADDPLTTLILGMKCPVLVCPAMNVHMYENPLVQGNIVRLSQAGMHVVGPGTGALACGDEGAGRLAELETIEEELRYLLASKDLAQERVLVTAGPTREPMDPVRFVSNPSSGRMGYAVAKTARRRGAKVVLVSGPVAFPDPYGVKTIRVCTAKEMFDGVMAEAQESTVVIKAAAVSDWRPTCVSRHKVKKGENQFQCTFEKTDDILAALGQAKGERVLVGFAAETQDLKENARAKLVGKNLDMVVANVVGQDGSGFGAETNQVSLLHKDGRAEDLPLMDKASLADVILDRVLEIRRARGEG